jgi:hypothetical protein
VAIQRLAWASGLCLPALPLPVQAANGGGSVLSTLLMLPFMLALAVALHVLLGRAAKAVASSASPLARGEPEAGGYQRSVYGTAQRAVLEVVVLVLVAGVSMWIGMAWAASWATWLGLLTLLGAVTLDLSRWERVTVSASYVWFQRGLGQTVHQVAIENIHDITVAEADVPGFTLRHLNRNRVCRLNMRLNDKLVVALPKTDAHGGGEAVEAVANLIRTRQGLVESRQALAKSSEEASRAAANAVLTQSDKDREMLRELRRLRQQALAPELPRAVSTPAPDAPASDS